jgi:hypothetical protein
MAAICQYVHGLPYIQRVGAGVACTARAICQYVHGLPYIQRVGAGVACTARAKQDWQIELGSCDMIQFCSESLSPQAPGLYHSVTTRNQETPAQ